MGLVVLSTSRGCLSEVLTSTGCCRRKYGKVDSAWCKAIRLSARCAEWLNSKDFERKDLHWSRIIHLANGVERCRANS